MTRATAFVRWLLTPIERLMVFLILGYQKFISPMLGPRCRYYPSCSNYALHSIRRHGPIKGFLLACWRLLRCNPFSKGGVDPVPSRGRWLPDVNPDGSSRSRSAKPDAKECSECSS